MIERGGGAWLKVLRHYFAVLASGMLVWEFAHFPLYTLWREGSWGQILFAGFHCTGGDLLIAAASVLAALLLLADWRWPQARYGVVAASAIIAGVLYTAFSEWLNIVVRKSWQYAPSMPVVDLLGFHVGLSPLAQWIVVPSLAFWLARRSVAFDQ